MAQIIEGDYTEDNFQSSTVDILAGAKVKTNQCVFIYHSAASPKNYRRVLVDAAQNLISLSAVPHSTTQSADEEFSRCDLTRIGDSTADNPLLVEFVMEDSGSHLLMVTRLIVEDDDVTFSGNAKDLLDSGQQDHVAIDQIDDSHVVTAHNKWVFPDGTIRIWLLTIALSEGNPDPVGKSINPLSVAATAKLDRPIGLAVPSSTRAFVFYQDDDGDIYAALINISDTTNGATLTDGPDSLYTASVGSSVRSRQKKAVAINSTTAVYSSGNHIVAVQNVGDVITPGTEVAVPAGRTILSLAHVGGGEVIASGAGPSGTLQFIRSYSVSGTTITDNDDEISLSQPPVAGAGVIAPSATNKVIAAMGTGGDVGSFEANDIEFAEIRTDPWSFRHSSLGIPGSVIT